MNFLNLVELPIREYALQHYKEALRLSGITSRAEVAAMLRQDFPDGGLAEYLRVLSPSHTYSEIGLFFFYLAASRAGGDTYRSLGQIYTVYSQNFSNSAFENNLSPKHRFYYIIRNSFGPIKAKMTTDAQSDEWRVYLDICMGKENMAA